MSDEGQDLAKAKRGFKGSFIPVEIWGLFDREELTHEQWLLLLLIDSLVHPKRGCWGRNEYLAEKMHCKPRNIQLLLRPLIEMGYVIEIGFNGRDRYLETAWSKVEPESRSKIAGGEVARGNKAVNQYSEDRKKVVRQRRRKPRPGGATSCATDAREVAPRVLYGVNGSKEPLEQEGKGVPTETPPPGEKGNLGLGKQGTINPASPDHAAVIQLQKALRENRQPAPWQPVKQTQHMTKLRKDVGDRLDPVLDWYCANLGQYKNLGLPLASSPAQFRARWTWIEERYEKNKQDAPVEISTHAARVVQILTTFHTWPKGCAPRLPQSVQRTMTAYSAWLRSVRELRQSGRWVRHDIFLAKILALAPSPPDFAEAWFERINARVHRWDDWSGELGPLEFPADGRWFERWGQGMAEEIGAPKLWELLKEELQRG